MDTQYSILIVEDNHGIRKLYEWILKNEGYSVTGASTVAECEKHLKENIPDLILMDNALPDGSGLEVLKRISMNRDYDSMFKLLISGEKTTEEDRMMGLNAGALDYMLKPIREDELITRVRMIFKIHEVEEKRRETEQQLNLELLDKNQSLRVYQNKLKESEERYKNIFENSAIGIFKSTPEGRYEFVNPAFAKIVGFESPEQMVTEVADISSLYADPAAREKIKEAFQNDGYVENYEIEVRNISGEILWMSVNAKQISLPQKGTFYEGTVQDITKRKLFEIELERQKNLFVSIVDKLPVMITVFDPSNNTLRLNKEMERLTGWTTEEASKVNFGEKIYPDPKIRKKAMEDMFHSGDEWNELDIVAKNREVITSEWSNMILDDGTKIGIGIDVRERKKARRELEESEQKLRNITNSVPGTIYQFMFKKNGTFSIPYFSNRAIELLGFDIEKMKDVEFLFSRIHPDDFDRITQSISEVNKEGARWSEEFRALNSKNEVVWIKGQSAGSMDKEGNIIHNGVILDITDKKLAEEELRKSEQKMREILDNSLDGILLTAPDGSVYSANSAACKMFGRTEEDICRIGRDGVVDMEDPRLKEFLETRNKKGKARAEVNLLRKDGSKFPAEVTSSFFKDTDGNIRSSMIIRDITERKIFEKKLKESKERFELAMKVSQDGLFDWNLETNEIYYSPGWKKMLGYEYDELPNDISVWESLTNPETVEESWKVQKKMLDKEISRFTTELKMKHKDGHWVDIYSKAEAFFNDQGKAVRIVGNHTDISERKKAEEALRESEKRYRHLFNNAQIGIYQTTVKDGLLIEANQRMAELLGYRTVQDAIGNYKAIDHYIDETEREELIKLLEEKGEFNNYEALIRINNEIKCFRFSGKLFKEEGYIQGVADDITERKKGELILKQYEKIVSSSGDALSLLDKDYRYRIVNNAYEKYSGITKEKLIGKTVEEYLGTEVFQENVKPLFDRCLNGESIQFSDWFEYKNLGKRFVTVNYYPYYNEKNEIDGIVASTMDITNLKNAEEDLKNKMNELQRINRMMIGRENRMFELKKEINELLEKLGEEKKYKAPDEF